MMGFLGLTADITGFTLDSDVLMVGMIFAGFLQILKSDRCQENRDDQRRQRRGER